MLKGRKSSFLDKLWRTSLKLPATPQTSLKRSVSREVMIMRIMMIFVFKQFGSHSPSRCLETIQSYSLQPTMRITQVRRGGEEGAGEVGKRRGRSRLTSHITSKKDHSDLDLNNFILLQKERQKQIHICDLITSYQYQVTHTAKLALRWSGARAGAGRGLAIRLQPALERNAPTRWNQTVFSYCAQIILFNASSSTGGRRVDWCSEKRSWFPPCLLPAPTWL